MNERIKELAERATASISYRVCQNTFKEIDDPTGPFVRKEFSKEKFSELIVRECAKTVNDTEYPYEDPAHKETWDACCVWSAEKLKEHFGVEE